MPDTTDDKQTDQPQVDGFGLVVPAQVTRVIDGDTIEVEIRRTVRVRLLDCWAPETRTRELEEKAKGLAAKQYLTKLCNGRPVQVAIPLDGDSKFGDSMTFGRVLGRVTDAEDGVDYGQLMVDSGHAAATKGGPLRHARPLKVYPPAVNEGAD